MGYSVSCIDSKFFFPYDKFREAFKIVKKRYPESEGRNLLELFEWWQWSAGVDDDGNINGIEFVGENLGSDEDFFRIIAPFVQDDSFIHMVGEEGEQWKWIFKDGKLVTKEPKLVWD
jgi:hypothetical protein